MRELPGVHDRHGAGPVIAAIKRWAASSVSSPEWFSPRDLAKFESVMTNDLLLTSLLRKRQEVVRCDLQERERAQDVHPAYYRGEMAAVGLETWSIGSEIRAPSNGCLGLPPDASDATPEGN